jgi:diguanylate cyclase
VFVDVDGMGRVNATLGHAAGDELLRLIAARLGDDVGMHVTVGRHGGDEFLLLLDDLSESTPIRITRCSSTPTRRCSTPSAEVAVGS